MVFLLTITLSTTGSLTLHAQSTSKVIETKVKTTYAEHIGTTLPLRDLLPTLPTDPAKRNWAKSLRRAPKNFIGRGKNTVTRPELVFQGPDPVRQTTFPTRKNNDEIITELNIQGLFSSFGSPHDPSGDIGRDYYIQAINATRIGVYDRTGELINAFAANILWQSINFTSAGDPIVLYDQEANRWVITEFPPGNQLLVAVSQTSDPLGSWDAWNFATPFFPDYPKYAVWNNTYSVTTNEEGPGVLHAYFLDREALLAGDPNVSIQRLELPGSTNTEAGFFVATPVDWSGNTSPTSDPMIVALNDSSWGELEEDAIEIYSIDLDWDNPDNTAVTNTTVLTTPFDGYACEAAGIGFACIPQAGGGIGLDGIPEVIMNQPHYRRFDTHESMVMTFMTDVDGNELSGVRWVELRRLRVEDDWTVYQEGTVAPPDGLHRFMPSIAMDRLGSIGLAYSVSSSESFAGIRYTGRLATDSLGVMTFPETTAVDGTNNIDSGSRFGDYSHMSIDPINDRTFWFTGEYAGGGNVRTRILGFSLRKDTTDIGPTKLLSPSNSPDLTATELVQVDIKNYGVDTQQVFQVGYIFNGETTVIDTLNQTLLPDSSFTHTFTETVDLERIDDYSFKLFTVLAEDEVVPNDTLNTVVTKQSKRDAGITVFQGISPINCGETLTLQMVLTNFGTETLTNVDIIVELNDALVETIEWEGALERGETTLVEITLDNLLNGANTISSTTANPNGVSDEVTANDARTQSVEVLVNGKEFLVKFNFDEYPEETSWELSDANGNVIFSGDSYGGMAFQDIEIPVCLDPTQCYTFEVFDAFSDGICCQYGEGSYEITTDIGLPVINSNGEFGDSESNDFCADIRCMLSVDIDFTSESETGAADGSIFLDPNNGAGPFQYSIDGGENFRPIGLFSGLTAGTYAVVVTGAADCNYTEEFELTLCALDILTSVTNESTVGANDGIIAIRAQGGLGPFLYSINGGQTFRSNDTFTGLDAGTYNVVIKDDGGCTAEIEVIIDVSTAIATFTQGQLIRIAPNPTEGVFRVEVEGFTGKSVFLPVGIYDATGKFLYQSQVTRYNDKYEGQLSLSPYPAGVYYVRFYDDAFDKMLRVVKK